MRRYFNRLSRILVPLLGLYGLALGQAPSITGLSPSSGAVGAVVTISGANFGASQGTSSITFNGHAASPTAWSSASITAPVPSGATTGNVVVTVGGTGSNGMSFTVLATPTITAMSPASGPVGTSVTITGSNLGSSGTISFNGIGATASSWSASSISVFVPTNATSGNVTITAAGLPLNAGTFTVVTAPPLPQVVQVQPSNAATGVFLNSRVIVRFAQAVQPISIVPGTLTVFKGSTQVSGSSALSNDGLSLTFTPSANLTASTSYSVSVTDVASNQTTPEFQSTFTTGTTTNTTAPQVSLTNPVNSATSVPINAPIVAQFSKPIDPATLTTQTFSILGQET